MTAGGARPGWLRRLVTSTPVRIGATYLALVAVVVLVVVVPVRRLLVRQVDDDIASDIEAEVENLRLVVADVDPKDGPVPERAVLEGFIDRSVPSEHEVLIAIHDGTVLDAVPQSVADRIATPDRVRDWSAVVDAQWGASVHEGNQFRWLSVRVGEEGIFVTAIDASGRRAGLDGVLDAVTLAALAALAIGGVLAWLATTRVPRLASEVGSDPAGAAAPPSPALTLDDDGGGEAPNGRFRLVDAADLTDEMLRRVRARHHQRRWLLRSTADGDLICDPDRIHQAVITLADNAVQHTNSGDAIEVSSRNEDGGVVFSVTDQGGDEADRAGNPIVKVVVAAHEGRFSMETNADDGAVFSFYVPRRPPGGRAPDVAAPAPEGAVR